MFFAFVIPPFLPARRGPSGTPRGSSRSPQNKGTKDRREALAWERLWPSFKQLTTLGFPRRFPLVQFPNLPLIVAFLASQIGRFVHGSEHNFARAVSYLAMTIWAYEELLKASTGPDAYWAPPT